MSRRRKKLQRLESGDVEWFNPTEGRAHFRANARFRNEAGDLIDSYPVLVNSGQGWEAPQMKSTVRLPLRSDRPILIGDRRERVGYSMVLDRPGKRGVFVDEHTVLYPGVAPDMDMRIRLTGSAIKVEYIVKGPGAPQELTFDLDPLGDGAIAQVGETVEITNPRGRGFRLLQPIAEDRRTGTLSFTDGQLRVSLPDLAGVSYPYVVDPQTVLIGQGNEKSTIYDGRSGRSGVSETWSTIRDGAGNSINASVNNTVFVAGASTDRFAQNFRTFINFPVATGDHLPPNAVITNAGFQIRKLSGSNNYSTSPAFNIVLVEGDSAAVVPTTGGYDQTTGGNLTALTDTEDVDTWGSGQVKGFSFLQAGLDALPNFNGNWHLALVFNEVDVLGQDAPWEAFANYDINFNDNEDATASRRPLLGIDFVLQPLVTYFIF